MKVFKNLGAGLWNILVSVDQLGNVLIGLGVVLVRGESVNYGDPDETISSVLGRKTKAKTTNPVEKGLVWALDKIDRDHALEAIEFNTKRQAVLRAPRH